MSFDYAMKKGNISCTKVYINDFKMHAFHGVLEQERTVGNDYIINLSIAYPFGKACESDDLNDTLSYAEVAETIKCEMLKPSKLLEHVAARIVESLASSFPLIDSIDIDIRKIAPPMPFEMNGAGVSLTWNRNK